MMRRILCAVSTVAIVGAIQAAALSGDRAALLGMFLVSVGVVGWISLMPTLARRADDAEARQ